MHTQVGICIDDNYRMESNELIKGYYGGNTYIIPTCEYLHRVEGYV